MSWQQHDKNGRRWWAAERVPCQVWRGEDYGTLRGGREAVPELVPGVWSLVKVALGRPLFVELGMEPMASHMQNMCSATELYYRV